MRGKLTSVPILILFALASTVWLGREVLQGGVIPFWRDAAYTDLLISHIPNSIFLKQALSRWGQIPLWNPTILSGIPFAADPLSGLWYPPNWLSLIIPVDTAFPILFWLHLTWAGLGTWRLARAEGVGEAGAIAAGLAFAGTPKFMAHIGLGHVGLVSAVSWTPWALLAARGALAHAGSPGRKWIRHAALGGTVLGVVFLADPRWSVPCTLLVFAYGLFRISGAAGERPGRGEAARAAAVYGFFAALVSAVLALPLLEFSRLSTRWDLSGQEQVLLSLPAAGLLNIFTPLRAQPEWFIFIGVAVLFLACCAFIRPDRTTWFWSGVVLAGVLLALGPATPLYPVFSTVIPGASLLRVPPRWLFIAWLGVALLAGHGVSRIMVHREEPAVKRRMRLFSLGFFTFCGLVSAGGMLLGPASSAPDGLYLLPVLLAFIWAIMTFTARFSSMQVATGWTLLLVLELALVNQGLLEYRTAASVWAENEVVLLSLPEREVPSRILSPSYSLPQHIAASAGLELADGVNPLQLRIYDTYMAEAMGYDSDGYEVTLPPFPSGDPGDPWGFDPQVELLGKLNVAVIVSDYPLSVPGLAASGLAGGTYIYELDQTRPRAWVESQAGEVRRVEKLEWTPNHVLVEAEGPGTLVLSEIMYPGWRAVVDGRKAGMIAYEDIFRAVELSEGAHQARFEFHPLSVLIGLTLTFVALAGLAWIFLRD